MILTVKIKRRKSAEEKPYYEEFRYEGNGKLTVAEFLTELNEGDPVKNAKGEATEKVTWECSCNEKKCGACSMLINGYPRLACSVFLCDIAKGKKITLAPLSKFPVVKDLKVDRTQMFELLKNMKVWQTKGEISSEKAENKMKYRASKCMLCGCCLEVCPNFTGADGFSGAFALAATFKAAKHNSDKKHVSELEKEYYRHFYKGCGQSLSCKDVCPFELPIDELQARMIK